ncbi:MAG: DUF2341 domain-containing protein [Candidatus Shapirobacteria bacterium]|nr:DUF2341 domain-containing protein [Candidatus Shapirobacteria bacterium]
MKRLHSLSYKTLLTILFFSLAGIVFFLKIGGKTQKVSAAWWDDAWHYRKSISVTNSSGSNLTDFQVSVSIGTSQLVADGKMQTDCDDIRITDINGNLLPYWIEENNPGCNQLTDTKVWLKANSLPTSGATIYVYYGNPSATNSENGNNVFEFFDNFKTYTGWTGDTGNFTSTTDGNRTVIKVNGNDAPGEIFKSINVPNNYIAEIAIKDSNESSNSPHPGLIFASNGTTSNYNGFYIRSQSDQIAGSNNGSYGSPVNSLTIDTNWHTYKTTIIGSTLVSLIVDNSTQVSAFDNLNITNSKSHIGLWSHDTQADGFYDNLFIRKYASSQPTSTPQSEESGGGPIAYWKFDEGVGSTAYDSAGNNNGTISGATWQNENQCISGKCLSFDGTNDFVNLTNLTNSGTTYTFSFWVYSRDSAASSKYFFDIESGRLLFGWGSDTAGKIGLYDGSWKLFGNSPSVNTWHHIEFVLNGSTSIAKMYLDGSQYGSDLSFTPHSMSGNISLGSRYSRDLYFFNGLIDEVKIYPYARTATQIKNDYNSRGSLSGSSANLGIKSNTAPSLKSSLIAHYKFDETSGTTAKNYGSLGSNYNLSNISFVPGKSGLGTSCPSSGSSGSNTINISNEISVSGWIYPTTYNGNLKGIVGMIGYGPYWGYSLNLSGQQLELRFQDSSGNWHSSYSSNYFNIGNTNVWTHITATHDGQNTKFYINGKFINQESMPYNHGVGSTNTIRICNVGWDTFEGKLDELKIYNKTLTADEVKQDYNAGSAIQFGTSNQTIGGTTTSLNYCIPGDTSYCAAPVAEWNFEENSGTTAKDTSGNNNNGTFGTGNSAPTWTIGTNNKGAGLNFDGSSDYIDINNSSSLSPMTNISLEAWVKPSSSGNYGIVSKHWTEYTLSLSSNQVRFESTNINQFSNSTIPTNRWSHIVVTYDSQNVKFYINGILNNTAVDADGLTNGSNNINIGKKTNESYHFPGSIDGVKIYNYARTPAQVAYDYNKGAPIGWWKFDECQGSTTFDSSGLGNTGVISIGLSGSQTSLGTCQTGTSAAWTNGSSGRTNSSLNFDGVDDKVTISDPGSNSPLDANGKNITLSAWIKGNNFSSGFKGIIVKQSAAPYEMWAYDDDLMCGFTIDGTIQRKTYAANFSPGVWYHTVCSYDGNNIKAYVNGILKQSWAQAGNVITDNNSPIYLGWSGYSTEYLNGQIDDVRIYNYALTSEQVKQVYNGGSINFQ